MSFSGDLCVASWVVHVLVGEGSDLGWGGRAKGIGGGKVVSYLCSITLGEEPLSLGNPGVPLLEDVIFAWVSRVRGIEVMTLGIEVGEDSLAFLPSFLEAMSH